MSFELNNKSLNFLLNPSSHSDKIWKTELFNINKSFNNKVLISFLSKNGFSVRFNPKTLTSQF